MAIKYEKIKAVIAIVKEVKSGFECGLMIENYSDIKVGDVIETYEEVKTERKL